MTALIDTFQGENPYAGKQIVVVGAGASGLAAGKLLLALGAKLRIVDSKKTQDSAVYKALPKAEFLFGEHTAEQFQDAAFVILSPGVPLQKLRPFLKNIAQDNIISELELGFGFVHEAIIAITGTNGKTTTTSLLSSLLEQAGKKIFTGGNIGTPLCEYLLADQKAEILVLEVSSFQLQNIKQFKPKVGVLLNFSANHLDYHQSMEEYLEAKLRLFSNQDAQDVALLPPSLHAIFQEQNTGQGRYIPLKSEELFEAPALQGKHNQENITAAWLAAQQFGVSQADASKAIYDFKAPAHRQEIISEKNEVLFINDSKATNLDASIAAISNQNRPIRLLLGGIFKGGDVKTLIPVCADKVIQIGLFGAGREHFEPILSPEFPLFWEENLEKAMQRMIANAMPGEVILLSPATSSFDAYTSYTERGEHFRRIVEAL